MLRCVRHIQPDLYLGIPPAQAMRWLFPRSFRSVRRSFTLQGWFPGAPTLEKLAEGISEHFPLVEVPPEETAAILFTSGSTGPAKGVVYQHGMFQAQVRALKALFDFQPGEIDMPGYPLFALFDTALAMTSVIPELNPSRPASCDPARLVEAMLRFQVTTCQGSPAIWNRVGRHCLEHGVVFENLRRVITFGAPISGDLVDIWREILPEQGDVFTPYGATEALPVAFISGREILEETAERATEGAGTCVGRPAPGIELRTLRLSDEPITTWDDDLVLPPGEVGEVVVRGEVVTREYAGLPDETSAAKIPGADGSVWHRMGDLGYLDEQGRLWFCGRKAHRVQTGQGNLFPVQAEGMANNHPSVFRSALVGVGAPGQQEPVLVVELEPGHLPKELEHEERLIREILARYDEHETFRAIRRVLFHPGFPVDPRHNAKIHREELAVWAAEQLAAQ
jgi:acyl-CoA synthetase (AMP-forming)/AMP-acid ligase II